MTISEKSDVFQVMQEEDGFRLSGKSASAFYRWPKDLLIRLTMIKYVHKLKISDKTLQRIGNIIKKQEEEEEHDS